MALQRRQRTRSSPSTTIASVMISGVDCTIAVMIASGRWGRLEMNRKATIASRPARSAAKGEASLARLPSWPVAATIDSAIAVANSPRTAMICPGGRVAEASFKRLSFVMKNAIARSIATMPRRLFLGDMGGDCSWRPV